MTRALVAAAIALPLLLLSVQPASASARVRFGISVATAPPPLPWYPQPPCPGYGFYWIPGHWGWGPYGYFWVPSAWVWPPVVGFLWTPGYWAWWRGHFWWHPGYWGRRVGFYGGIAYGHGYNGHGYHGGRWHHGRFRYNRAVNNLKADMRQDSYNQPIKHPARKHRRVSYNGGKGGIDLRPTATQTHMLQKQRFEATSAQRHLITEARKNPALRFADNRGRPEPGRIERIAHPKLPRQGPTQQPDRSFITPRPRPATPPERHHKPPALKVLPRLIHHPVQIRPVITPQPHPATPPQRPQHPAKPHRRIRPPAQHAQPPKAPRHHSLPRVEHRRAAPPVHQHAHKHKDDDGRRR